MKTYPRFLPICAPSHPASSSSAHFSSGKRRPDERASENEQSGGCEELFEELFGGGGDVGGARGLTARILQCMLPHDAVAPHVDGRFSNYRLPISL